MSVYDHTVNNVPTSNIPTLIKQTGKRLGIPTDDVPHRNTVELMARELGVMHEHYSTAMRAGYALNDLTIILRNELIKAGMDEKDRQVGKFLFVKEGELREKTLNCIGAT